MLQRPRTPERAADRGSSKEDASLAWLSACQTLAVSPCFHGMTKSPYRSRGFLLVSLLAAVLAASSACTSVQVNPNTVGAYEMGELRVMANANIDRVYLAAKAAIPADGLFLTGDRWGGTTATLTARDEIDTRVTIKIKQMAPNETSVRIRYGLTGDLHQAQTLYTRIENRL
jgi:hypothetical protein